MVCHPTSTSVLVASSLLTLSLATPYQERWCRRGQACWPTKADIDDLASKLDPTKNRNLHWRGPGTPYTTAFPNESPGEQPLWGMNEHLQPLYVSSDTSSCIPGVNSSDFCKQSTRNFPMEGWEPAFIAWPLTSEHVQHLVTFARDHELCISVAGTGHELLNRHSCDQGLLIRTALMKDIEWKKSSSHAQGADSVRLGPGLTFQEIQKSGAEQEPSRFVATGWCSTVGIVGWSIGGGHGPFGRAYGSGVDNIIEVELVTSDGNLVTANATQNSKLLWALRGGGGSTWGVITAITVQAHATPQQGFTRLKGAWTFGSSCNQSSESDMLPLQNALEGYTKWLQGLDHHWSGQGGVGRSASVTGGCGYIELDYLYVGGERDAAFIDGKKRLFEVMHAEGASSSVHALASMTAFADAWEFIQNISGMEDGGSLLSYPKTGRPTWPTWTGNPSVLLNDTVVRDNLTTTLVSEMSRHPSPEYRVSLFHDIRSHGYVHDNSTSVGPGLQTGTLHLMGIPAPVDSYYALSAHSYFSESEYQLRNWQERYWGHENYQALLNIKRKFDPDHLFWCHQCVGSEELPRPRRLAPILL